MAKLQIKILPDGSIQMKTNGIKGKKCENYAKVLERLADVKVYQLEKTNEFYQEELQTLDEVQHLNDN